MDLCNVCSGIKVVNTFQANLTDKNYFMISLTIKKDKPGQFNAFADDKTYLKQ